MNNSIGKSSNSLKKLLLLTTSKKAFLIIKTCTKRIFLLVSLIVLTSCSELSRTKDELTQNAQVYAEDAFKTIEYAKGFNPNNSEIHERSVAQVVFPKAVKGSFIFGGNYAEGYLVENGQIIDQIRMIGGNIGPNIGGQSYSQITYVMDPGTSIRNTNRAKIFVTRDCKLCQIWSKYDRYFWSNI